MWTKVIVMAVAGALGAALANRGIVIFHDAVRSIFPEVLTGRMQRREFATLTIGSGLGLIFYFGISFSLVSTIVLSHALWLGTDIIGAWFPGSFDQEKNPTLKSLLGLVGSIICGGLYGVLLIAAIQSIHSLVARLPVDFFSNLSNLSNLSAPIIFTLAVIPALSITFQYGIKPGLIAFLISLIVRQAASFFNSAQPDSWAFLVGMLALVYHTIQEARSETAPEDLLVISNENVKRVRRHLPWIAVLGAVYAISANTGVLMEGPQSVLALAQGDRINAINYTIARALSFLPMRTMSILTTGVFTIDGLGLAPTLGLVAPNLWLAALAGAAVMSTEAMSLVAIARLFNRFPCILKTANSIRTAMTRLLEIASLIGGMIAANSMAPGFGFFAVAGLYLLNEAAGAPVVRTAVGPISIILFGLVLNLLTLLHWL